MTVGLDRGVALPLATSDGQRFEFSKAQEKHLEAQERHKKRWQRRQARRSNAIKRAKHKALQDAARSTGLALPADLQLPARKSQRWVKARRKVARYQRYGADVRRELAHHTSHALANDLRYKLFVFEALKVVNMTKKPKAQKDAHGRWMRSGAAAQQPRRDSTKPSWPRPGARPGFLPSTRRAVLAS